jgi:methyltransferase (TIGR00027 family)
MDVSVVESIGKTAFVIAHWRVRETESVDPLFYDHIANIFLNDASHRLAEAIRRTSPSTERLIHFRTRYFDDSLEKAFSDGIRQCVLLGAGLDTRAFRLGAEGLRFYEVDQGDVIRFKRERLEAYGYHIQHALIGCDYVREDWLDRLLRSGLDFSRPCHFIWEGNSMYIPKAKIVDLLKTITQRLQRFTFAFDYLSEKLVSAANGRIAQGLLDGFQNLGAPWITGFDDITWLCRETGLSIEDVCLLAEAGNRYCSAKALDPRLLDDYSVCLLKNPAV